MSHARAGVLAVPALLLGAAVAAAYPAVTTSNLNLRSGPGPAFGIETVMPRRACRGSGTGAIATGATRIGVISTGTIACGADTPLPQS
jgi:hypothetical protein